MDATQNVKLVQDLVGKYLAGDAEGYIAGCHDEFKGDVLAGLVPGGENIVGLEAFKAMMPEMAKLMDVKKFEPANWVGVGDNVFFTVDWEFVWLPTGKTVTTTATVRKVIRDGKICEKYHRVNSMAVTAAIATPAKPCFYTVVHEFKEGQAEGWWANMATMTPDDMAAMAKKHIGMGYVNHSFMPSVTHPTLINCVWECKDVDCSPEQFQAFIDGPESPAPKGVFVNTCYKVMDGAMMPAAFDFAAPPAPAAPTPSSGSFFWVYHEFQEGAASSFWAMMGEMGAQDMAAMHAKNETLGFSNHSFQPCAPEGPVICVWESKESMSEQQFQQFIDGPDGPGAGRVFVNTVHKCHPQGNPPPAKFTHAAAQSAAEQAAAEPKGRFSATAVAKSESAEKKRKSIFRRVFSRGSGSCYGGTSLPASPAA